MGIFSWYATDIVFITVLDAGQSLVKSKSNRFNPTKDNPSCLLTFQIFFPDSANSPSALSATTPVPLVWINIGFPLPSDSFFLFLILIPSMTALVKGRSSASAQLNTISASEVNVTIRSRSSCPPVTTWLTPIFFTASIDVGLRTRAVTTHLGYARRTEARTEPVKRIP